MTTTTADPTISNNGGGINYLEYGLQGFTPGTGANAGIGGTLVAVSGSTNHLVITGLLPNTQYSIYTRKDCSGTWSINSSKVDFYTLQCQTTFTYTPLGTVYYLQSTGAGQYASFGSCSSSPTPGQESYWSFIPPSSGYYDITVTSTDPINNNYVLLGRINSSTCNVSSYNCMSPTSSSTSFGIQQDIYTWGPLNAGTQYNLLFDQADIGSLAPNNLYFSIKCPMPSAVTYSDIQPSSVLFNWTCSCPATTYLEYGLQGFASGTGATAGTGGTILSNVSPPYAVTGLLADTKFDFYLRSNCGGNFTTNTTVTTVKTAQSCNTASVITCNDYFEYYVAGGTLPEGAWNNTGSARENIWRFTPTQTGSYSLLNYSMSANSINNSYTTQIYVKLASSSCNEQGWNNVGSVSGPLSTFAAQTVNLGSLTAGVTYLIMADGTQATFTNGYRYYFRLDCPNVCEYPKLSYTTSVSPTSVEVKTDCPTCFGNLILEYGPSGFTPGTGASAGINGTAIPVSTFPYTITGLTSGATYDLYARTNCSAGVYSINAVKLSFTTISCTAPTAIITPAGPTTVCSGSVVLNANTGTGLTYQWRVGGVNISGATNSSYTSTSTGSYTVVVTATGGCSSTSVATIVTIGSLTATLTPPGTSSICAGTAITLSATTGTGYTYQWYRNNALLSAVTPSYSTTSGGTYKCVVTSGTCTATTNSVVVTQITNPTPAITYNSPLSFCSPGSVTLTANTFAGVTWQWENNSVPIAGATSQNYVATTAGLYRCNETANGCSRYTGKVSVSAATAAVAAISTTDPTTLCSGGSVNMTVSNPIPGYSYQWKKNTVAIAGATATGYAATATGSYTVTATAVCGTATSNAIAVSIGSFAAQVTPGGTVAMCTGGSLLLTANTGTGFTYQWKKNNVNIAGATAATYSVTTAGSYTVSMTSPCGNGTSAATVVSQNTVTASLAPAGTSIVCSGTAQSFTANAGSGYTYRWYRNNVLLSVTTQTYTTTSDGSYKVEVSIGGSCALLSNTAVLTVINNPTPTITASGPTTFCAGQSVTFTANTFAGVVYQWQKNSVNIAGATSQSYTATTAGTYRAGETAGGCSKFTPKKAVTVNCRLGNDGEEINTGETSNGTTIEVFPNPFNDRFMIEINSKENKPAALTITDVLGKTLYSQIVNAQIKNEINAKLAPGVYLLTIKANDKSKTVRIVKTNNQ